MRIENQGLRPTSPSGASPEDLGPPGPNSLRQRPQGAPSGLPGLPGFVALDRDSLELPSTTSHSSLHPLAPGGRAALELEAPLPEAEARGGAWRTVCGWLPCFWRPTTREGVQTANARGWLGHFIRWMPLVGAIVGSISLYFAVRNFRLIFAQRTLALLRQTGPSLQQAHNDILDGLIKIQEKLGIVNTSTLEPDLPPDPVVVGPGRR